MDHPGPSLVILTCLLRAGALIARMAKAFRARRKIPLPAIRERSWADH